VTPATRAALAVPPALLGEGGPIRLQVAADMAALTRHFADALLEEYRACLAAGRSRAVFIVPVGPIGQFDLLAARCNAERQSLARRVLINMDEYLDASGQWIDPRDPLSFRGHMRRHFFDVLDPLLAPPEAQNIFPDPAAPERLGEAIAGLGGVDVCFGGVGISGHLAFNDPPEPSEPDDPDAFARLPTRVVTLSRETLTINAVTAARGNIARIPQLAVTVGMAEILAARRVRLYMNRPWQSAMIRRLLHGPVSAAVPASLLQRHPDASVTATDDVTRMPEPELG
jgi:glucosamine-6-phosphate deaminase